MDAGTLLIINLVISIAIILVLIIAFKVNPSIAMIVACLYMGIASGLGIVKTMSEITGGFGSMMSSMGLPIGLGVILGSFCQTAEGLASLQRHWFQSFLQKERCMPLHLRDLSFQSPCILT